MSKLFLVGFFSVFLFGLSLGTICEGPDAKFCGTQCYDDWQHVCVENRTLCPVQAPNLCGDGSCFSSEIYQCCNGIRLAPQNQVCPPLPECCGSNGKLFGTPSQRQTCYNFINSAGFAPNPTTGEPYFSYFPCPPTGDRRRCVDGPGRIIINSGCRQCELDPINDMRCEGYEWGGDPKRSDGAFPCPCEVIDWLIDQNKTNLLPTIYRSDPVCARPDPASCASPPEQSGSCDHYCGEKKEACYNPDQYVCNDEIYLCPKTAPKSCGKACFSDTQYKCCPGDVLRQIGEDCPFHEPTFPGCCPGGSDLIGEEQKRAYCYEITSSVFIPLYYNPCPMFQGQPGPESPGCDLYTNQLLQFILYETDYPDESKSMLVDALEFGCRPCGLPLDIDIRCDPKKRYLKKFSRDVPEIEDVVNWFTSLNTCPCEFIGKVVELVVENVGDIEYTEPECELLPECRSSKYGVIQSKTEKNSSATSIPAIFLVAFLLVLSFF